MGAMSTVARLHLFNVTSWTRSYAKAAAALLAHAEREDQVETLAMPIFFLQRHALELAIKSVIETFEGHIQNELVARAAEQEWRDLWKTWNASESAGSSTHDLDRLIGIAKDLLAARAWPEPLPSEFQVLADLIGRFEDDGSGAARVDRSRYRTMKRKKKANEVRRDLDSVRMLEPDGAGWKPVTTEIPLGEIQRQLDALLDGPMRYESDEDDTFLAGIAQHEQAGDSHLFERGRG